jgi:two-component system response regulator FixJ
MTARRTGNYVHATRNNTYCVRRLTDEHECGLHSSRMSDAAQLVFVVDDDALTLRYYRAALEGAGHRCSLLDSAEAFFRIYDPGQAGCLILDVEMPGMNGPAVQQRLNLMGAIIPVIFISGHAALALAVEAMRNGALDFLEKPVSNDRLIAHVRKALDYDTKNRLVLQERERIAQAFSTLTGRELAVLRLLISGQSNKVMAAALNLSPRTVELHRARVMEKTGSRSLAHLIRMSMDLKFAPHVSLAE